VKTFRDTNGREWPIEINVNSLKRVKDSVEGFDLLRVVEDQATLDRIINDPFTLVATLYAILEPKATAAGITPEGFGEAMGNGDALAQASDALLADLADFFPPHRRGPMKAAIHKLHQVQKKAAELATARIESPEMERAALAILEERLNAPLAKYGGSSTNPPASSALTQDPSLSAN
jgi:hypothetical protein